MQIPGYEIKRTIGKGGMATVYLAEQKSLGREIVLKTLNANQTENRDFLERFVNEGRMVASLRHPHIITIHDIGTADDLVYIAMEYVEGGDLKSRLVEPMTPLDALDIVEAVTMALSFAHTQGIVHRDVKPANILFRADGIPLLSDFGIAKQVAVDSELTSTGTILGSPFYMSPEQAEGLPVDGRSDIYSLGIIFYEMLCGRRPYDGDSAIKVIMQHIQAPLPRLPESLADFQPLVERMLAKNRDKRVPDADSLLNEVRRLQARLRAASASTPDPKEIGRSPRPATRVPPRLRLALLLGCLVLVAGALWGFYRHVDSQAPAVVARHPSPGGVPATTAGTAHDATTDVPPAPAPGSVARADVIQALSWLARSAISDDRLLQPPADNAYYYYSRLLELDPGNTAAREGFGRIAERYLTLAEHEYARRNYGRAQVYIAFGLQVQPDNRGLASLQELLETRERSLIDTLIGLFRPGA